MTEFDKDYDLMVAAKLEQVRQAEFERRATELNPNLPVQAFISDLPDDASFELWHRRFASLKLIEDAWPFLVGDSLVYAEKRGKEFEDRAVQAAADLGYKPHSLLNMKAVCARIPKPRRRETEASYSHHAAVAYLDEHSADMLLNDAINDGWTVSQLRNEARTAAGKPAREAKAKADWRDEMLVEAEGLIEMVEDGQAKGWLKRYRDATQKP